MMQSALEKLLRVFVPGLLTLQLAGCAALNTDNNLWQQPGAYQVAHNDELVVQDSVQARDVMLQVSWPVQSKGPLPVVVFSHGAFCYPQQYRNITDFWVSHGYVVILPNHLDSPNRGKLKPQEISQLLDARVRDMSFVLDALPEIEAQIPELAGRIDADKAAVAGHSFGGMIAMVKSGLHMQQADGTVQTSWADPRFRAAVVMSGVGQVGPDARLPQQAFMSADAFNGLTGPLIANGGTLDEGNVGTGEIYPWQWRMSPYTLAPPGDKYSLILQDADHYLGGLICRDNRGGPDDPAGVAVVRAAQTAFLDAYLKDDRAAGRWLRTADFSELSDGRADLKFK
ncbi:MAG: dienelactone hydrolase family protein [Gammaproteobacteria bacterium]|jgi:pimeloyl-ACP methyl ester carboxylesterase